MAMVSALNYRNTLLVYFFRCRDSKGSYVSLSPPFFAVKLGTFIDVSLWGWLDLE